MRVQSETAPGSGGSLHEHVIVIQKLAKDFDLPTKAVADMYWPELARLKQGATIDLYLPLLTERRVRDSLRRTATRRSKAKRHGLEALELVVD